LSPERFSGLPKRSLEELHISAPDLFQDYASLQAVLRNLADNLVQTNGQDGHKLLNHLRQVLFAELLRIGMLALLSIGLERS